MDMVGIMRSNSCCRACVAAEVAFQITRGQYHSEDTSSVLISVLLVLCVFVCVCVSGYTQTVEAAVHQ